MTLFTNVNSVCFANSVVCMLSNAPFIKSFLDNPLEGAVCETLADLLKSIFEDRKKHGKLVDRNKNDVFDVTTLLHAMKEHKETLNFFDGTFHDPSEFLIALVDTIAEQNELSSFEIFPLLKLGNYTEIKCQSCEYKGSNAGDFFFWNLISVDDDGNHSVNIEDMIAKSGVNRTEKRIEYECEVCKKNGKESKFATEITYIKNPPDHLILYPNKNNTAEGFVGSLNSWDGMHEVYRDRLEFAGKHYVPWSFVVLSSFNNDDGDSDDFGNDSKGPERMDNSKTLHFSLASRHLMDDGSANSFCYFDDESFRELAENDIELYANTSTLLYYVEEEVAKAYLKDDPKSISPITPMKGSQQTIEIDDSKETPSSTMRINPNISISCRCNQLPDIHKAFLEKIANGLKGVVRPDSNNCPCDEADDPPLWMYLNSDDSRNLQALCLTHSGDDKRFYNNTFRVHVSENLPNSTTNNVRTEAALSFLKKKFDEPNHENIDKCVSNGIVLTIYGRQMKSSDVVVICAAVYVFFKDGCYLNYIATDHEMKFNRTLFGSFADDHLFSKRGLATKVISIIYLHALYMEQNLFGFRNAQIFLQCNDELMNFYQARLFRKYLGPIPDSLRNLINDDSGHCVCYVDPDEDDPMSLMRLRREPIQAKTALPLFMLSYNEVILSDITPGFFNGRQPARKHSTKVNKPGSISLIKNDFFALAHAKKTTAFSELKELQDNSPFCDGFTTKVFDHRAEVNEIFDGLIFLEFPFKNNKHVTPAVIENCLDGLPVFSNECFRFDSSSNSNTDSRISSQMLSLGSFFNCIFQYWFHGDLIQFFLKVLLRNPKNAAKFLVVPHPYIMELVGSHMVSNKRKKSKQKKSMKNVFEHVYKNVKLNSVTKKIFSHDVWLFFENVGAYHWTCRFLFYPNALFDVNDPRDCFLMTLDKNKRAIEEDTVLFNKFVYYWMSYVWFLENDTATLNKREKTMKDIEKVMNLGASRFAKSSSYGGMKNYVKKVNIANVPIQKDDHSCGPIAVYLAALIVSSCLGGKNFEYNQICSDKFNLPELNNCNLTDEFEVYQIRRVCHELIRRLFFVPHSSAKHCIGLREYVIKRAMDIIQNAFVTEVELLTIRDKKNEQKKRGENEQRKKGDSKQGKKVKSVKETQENKQVKGKKHKKKVKENVEEGKAKVSNETKGPEKFNDEEEKVLKEAQTEKSSEKEKVESNKKPPDDKLVVPENEKKKASNETKEPEKSNKEQEKVLKKAQTEKSSQKEKVESNKKPPDDKLVVSENEKKKVSNETKEPEKSNEEEEKVLKETETEKLSEKEKDESTKKPEEVHKEKEVEATEKPQAIDNEKDVKSTDTPEKTNSDEAGDDGDKVTSVELGVSNDKEIENKATNLIIGKNDGVEASTEKPSDQQNPSAEDWGPPSASKDCGNGWKAVFQKERENSPGKDASGWHQQPKTAIVTQPDPVSQDLNNEFTAVGTQDDDDKATLKDDDDEATVTDNDDYDDFFNSDSDSDKDDNVKLKDLKEKTASRGKTLRGAKKRFERNEKKRKLDALSEKARARKEEEQNRENRSEKSNQKSFFSPRKQPRSRGKDMQKLKSTKKRKDEDVAPSPLPFLKRPKVFMSMDNSFYSNVDNNEIEYFAPGDQYKKWKNEFGGMDKQLHDRYKSNEEDLHYYRKQKNDLKKEGLEATQRIQSQIDLLNNEFMHCGPGTQQERIFRDRLKVLEKELKDCQTTCKLLSGVTHLVFKGRRRDNKTANFSREHFLGYTPEQAMALNNGSQPFGKPVTVSMSQAKQICKPDFLYMLMQNAYEGSSILEEAVEVDLVAGYKLESFQQKLAVLSDNTTHDPDRQCQRLIFRAFDANGNKQNGQSWVACFKDGSEEVVTDNWVKQNFDKKFLDKIVHEVYNRRENKLVGIPARSSKNFSGDLKILKESNGPLIQHRQGTNNFCLSYSWGSALHYFFGEKKRKSIHSITNRAQKTSTSLNFFEDMVRLTLEAFSQHMVLTLAHPDMIDLEFDVFHDKSDYPTLVVVEGSDNGINHAVGVVGDWVFETNCERALKLSKTTMDFCVSTEERKSLYVGAYWAIRLIPRPPVIPFDDFNVFNSAKCKSTVHFVLSLLFRLIGQERIHKRFWHFTSSCVLTRKNAFDGLFGELGVFQQDFILKREVEVSRFKVKNPKWSWPSLNAWLLIVFSSKFDEKLSAGVAIGNWMIDGKSSEFVYMDKVFWNKHKIVRGYYLKIREFGTIHGTFNQFLGMHPIMKYGVDANE